MALRVLAITRIFPNRVDPTACPYNRQQYAALARLCQLDVMAVIPWFPGARLTGPRTLGGRYAAVPGQDVVGGLPVEHPRVLYLPGVHLPSPLLYWLSLLPRLEAHRGRVDVVLGSWAFPDGVAAVAAARWLGVPAVVMALGSDINVVARRRSLRPVMAAALRRAARVVAVSRPLADQIVGLGVPRERVVFVPNGVDRSVFKPGDRRGARAHLGVDPAARLALFVGRMEAAKGVLDLLAAFAQVAERQPRLQLAFVGDGPAAGDARAAAQRWPGRVFAAGALPLEGVARWLAACDLLALPSWNEGTPNVVLEALASGRPVLASRVGGIPDVITSPSLGELVPPRDVPALAAALERAVAARHDPDEILRAAPGDWSESAARLHDVLAAAAGRGT